MGGIACSSLPIPPTFGLYSVSKLFYLLLIAVGALMTLAWIGILIWAVISLAQRVF